jgi:hypothetical protein
MSSSPHLTATITDGTHQNVNGVYLTMTAPGLGFAGSGNYEHVNNGGNPAWLFNLNSTSGLTTGSFTLISKTGNNGFTTPTITIASSSTIQAAKSGDYFNLGFAFAEGKNSTDGRYAGAEFGFGDSITYFIAGLTSSSFAPSLKNGHPDTCYSAAAIDDANPGLWIAGTLELPPNPQGQGGPQASPEPSSLHSVLACGVALVAFFRRLRSSFQSGHRPVPA